MFEGGGARWFYGDLPGLQVYGWGNVGGGGSNFFFTNIERWLKFTDHINK